MRLPSGWLELDEVSSTQDVAASLLLLEREPPEILLARTQLAGRGRLGRQWVSPPDSSMSLSLIFPPHPAPYLLGMAVAWAAASVLGADLKWPNDIFGEGKKLGGILTEILPDLWGNKRPVVGIGINLTTQSFPPEISHRATSLALLGWPVFTPKELATRIVDKLSRIEKIETWRDLAPLWSVHDRTPGTKYVSADGYEHIAEGIGQNGQLMTLEHKEILAADAWFGSAGDLAN